MITPTSATHTAYSKRFDDGAGYEPPGLYATSDGVAEDDSAHPAKLELLFVGVVDGQVHCPPVATEMLDGAPVPPFASKEIVYAATQCAYRVVFAVGVYVSPAPPTRVPPVAAVYQPSSMYPCLLTAGSADTP